MLPVFLACRVPKPELVCSLEKSPGEVWGRPQPWPLHWPRQGEQTPPDPPCCQVQRWECWAASVPLHGRHLLLPGSQHLVKGVSADGGSVGTRTGENVSKRRINGIKFATTIKMIHLHPSRAPVFISNILGINFILIYLFRWASLHYFLFAFFKSSKLGWSAPGNAWMCEDKKTALSQLFLGEGKKKKNN